MNLDHHIEELLFTNDCVIIPTIGGFIGNYSPASIDFIDQQVYPPQKSISFNPKLVNNDGLLANHIAQKDHLSYKQATVLVDEYTQQIEEDLFNNKIIHFENIGKLYFNSDSKLEFVPAKTNFLRDAYGLPSVACNPILRNKEYLVKENNNVQGSTAKKNNAIQKTKPVKSFELAAYLTKPRIAAAAVLLIFALAGPSVYQAIFSSNNQTNLVADNNPKKDSNKTSNASILPSPTVTENNNSDIDNNEALNNTEVIVDTTATIVEEIPVEEPEPIIDPNTEDFVIVLGAFGKRKNADRLAKKLAKDNYLPDVTLKNGLNRVGVQITCTPKELKTHLKFLQDNYNKKAWVVE